MDSKRTDEAPPALYLHCVAAYDKMLQQAKYVGNNNKILVYEGYLTQLIQGELSLSVPYYTSIRKKLLDMGCIRQLKRGGGTSPSQWELIFEPTLDNYTNATPSKVPKQTKESATNQQILTLNRRMDKLERTQGEIMKFLQDKFGSEEAR